MYNLDYIFEQLNAIRSKKIKSKIPLKIIFMIEDIINLRINKWNDNRIDSYIILINKIKDHLHDDNKILVIYKLYLILVVQLN